MEEIDSNVAKNLENQVVEVPDMLLSWYHLDEHGKSLELGSKLVNDSLFNSFIDALCRKLSSPDSNTANTVQITLDSIETLFRYEELHTDIVNKSSIVRFLSLFSKCSEGRIQMQMLLMLQDLIVRHPHRAQIFRTFGVVTALLDVKPLASYSVRVKCVEIITILISEDASLQRELAPHPWLERCCIGIRLWEFWEAVVTDEVAQLLDEAAKKKKNQYTKISEREELLNEICAQIEATTAENHSVDETPFELIEKVRSCVCRKVNTPL